MPSGTCDPASRGMGFNQGTMIQGPNGGVVVTYRYGWDGASVMPECVGPILSISAVNNEAVTYYAHFQGRKGLWKVIGLAPGNSIFEDRANVLRQQGFETNQDVEGLYITTDPTPPLLALAKN